MATAAARDERKRRSPLLVRAIFAFLGAAVVAGLAAAVVARTRAAPTVPVDSVATPPAPARAPLPPPAPSTPPALVPASLSPPPSIETARTTRKGGGKRRAQVTRPAETSDGRDLFNDTK